MFWGDRVTKVAGIALLLLATLVVVDAVLEAVAVGDANQLKRGDIEGLLRDINDKEALFFVGNAFGIVVDSAILFAVAATMYLAFRERSQVLAVFGLVGLFGAGIAFVLADGASMTVGVLAADFVEGGAGGIAPGDPVTLETARSMAAFWALADMIGLTMLAFGLIALGSLLAWAPEATVNPPRWLGGVAVASSVALLGSWVVVASEGAGLTLSGVGIIGSLLFIVSLGGWLLMRPEGQAQLEPRPAGAGA